MGLREIPINLLRMSLNVPVNNLTRLRIHGYIARAVHDTICNNSLGIKALIWSLGRLY